jgi:ABC-type glycerol-3-phosphate transport system substrate-binding protein
VDGIEPPVVYTEADVLVIPRGSPHPDAAFAFIRFVQEQTNMELLCRGQLKASPLAQVSPTFFATHPHPYLPLFYETTFSPRAFTTPAFSIHEEMVREVNVAIDGVRLLRLAPDDAAALLQSRGQRALNRMLAQRARRGENILPEAP